MEEGLLLTPCAKTQPVERHIFKRDFKRPYRGWQAGVAGNLAKKTKLTLSTYFTDRRLTGIDLWSLVWYGIYWARMWFVCSDYWQAYRMLPIQEKELTAKQAAVWGFQIAIFMEVCRLFVYSELGFRMQSAIFLNSQTVLRWEGWHEASKNACLESRLVWQPECRARPHPAIQRLSKPESTREVNTKSLVSKREYQCVVMEEKHRGTTPKSYHQDWSLNTMISSFKVLTADYTLQKMPL